MACASCGAQVPAGAVFCPQCGTRIEADPAPWGAPSSDETRVQGPWAHDATQVSTPPPAVPSPAAGAPPWLAPVPPPPPTVQPQASYAPLPPGWTGPQSSPVGVQPGPSWAPTGSPIGTAPSPPSSDATPGSIGGAIVAVLGGALTLAGVFSGWVTLDDGTGADTVTGWSLTSGDGLLKSSDPYLLVVLALVAMVAGGVLATGSVRTPTRIVVALVGVAIVVVAALNWFAIAGYVSNNFPSTFTAASSVGFYLAIGGGVVTALASLMPVRS